MPRYKGIQQQGQLLYGWTILLLLSICRVISISNAHSHPSIHSRPHVLAAAQQKHFGLTHPLSRNTIVHLRCGASTVSDEDDDDSDLEEEIVIPHASSKSTLQAALQSKAKQESLSQAAVKSSVKATKTVLQSSMEKSKGTSTKRRSSSILKKIPYIIRASLNPLILFSMTRLYFASLFNINFMQEVSEKILQSCNLVIFFRT
jgi:hypothetical protein